MLFLEVSRVKLMSSLIWNQFYLSASDGNELNICIFSFSLPLSPWKQAVERVLLYEGIELAPLAPTPGISHLSHVENPITTKLHICTLSFIYLTWSPLSESIGFEISY